MATAASIKIPDNVVQETLEAHAILWNQTFSYIKSMSLKCAVELHIPDAIHRHGMPITISQLLSSLSISQDKSRYLRSIMRVLSQERIFKSHITPSGEETFDLTPVSRLLLTASSFPHNPNTSPLVLLSLNHRIVDSHHQLSRWFHEPDATITPFVMTNGKAIWNLGRELPQFNDLINKTMECDSNFLMNVMASKGWLSFQGIGTLVDVGGGTGLMAAKLVEAFPGLKCIVLDLPHVIDMTERKTDKIQFIAGDMFVEVPHADVALLKWILHDWKDEDCVKILQILQRCKEAIPPKEKGGKVIIIDIVVGLKFNSHTSLQTQLLFDLHMLASCMGQERDESEWRNLFVTAGYRDYKIIPYVDHMRSIIEVYP
ncbi:trans-resveratrol di-O-methyltransferase-like [Phalaenopsis equestris]|uniref:trans-resveratrol di-O-methyltransferase-like n=1 Tax=Phalaenopsis equestris TaxID=78828 RepID=UPI0009E61A00|nr:trans-resveratrol di-O-methyltransferase-like [Phalaenopsis equestris]